VLFLYICCILLYLLQVMIYADTCAEWLMTSLACFKSSLPIVTIYTNLGQSGVSFSINQVSPS